MTWVSLGFTAPVATSTHHPSHLQSFCHPREARIIGRKLAVSTLLQLQHGLLLHLVRTCDPATRAASSCASQQHLTLPLALCCSSLTDYSRMVNFAVAAFIVLGGVAKLFPFDDL